MVQNKKEQILLAASECFAKFGYKKTTLEDIGKKIGLDKSSIYYYFKSKEEIFTIIVLDEFQQFINKLHQEMEEDMECKQKIILYFEEKLHFWFQKSNVLPQIMELEPEKLQYLMMSLGMSTYLKIEETEKTFVADILKKCIENGQIKKCNVVKVSEFMFALVDGIKDNYTKFTDNNYIPSKNHKEIIENIREALGIFMNGLK